MCYYGAWASGAMGLSCNPMIVGYCTICGMETCMACYKIGQDDYDGRCPDGNCKGKFKLIDEN